MLEEINQAENLVQALTEYMDLIEELYMVTISYIFEDPNTEPNHFITRQGCDKEEISS